MTIKIAFFDTKDYDKKFFQKHNESFKFKFKFYKTHLNPDTASLAEGYDAVCAFVNDDISEKTIKILYELDVELIALRCAGYNNVDFKAAFEKIHVARVPEYSPYAVAEHTAALMFALNRKIHRAYNRTRDGNFSLHGLLGFDFKGKTMGVIGTGKIGKTLIKILSGLSMNILAYDPFPDEKYASEIGYKYADLNSLYEKSDIISLNCPLNDETKYMINEDSISRMKRGVMLINTGRGKLINTQALINGLKEKQIGSAGLDVYEEESEYFFEDKSDAILDDDTLARLLTFNNVLITSHQGFFTEEALDNIAETTLQNIEDYFEGKDLENEICYQCQTPPCKGEDKKSSKCAFIIR